MYLSDLRLLIELENFDKGGLQKVVYDSAVLFHKHGIQTTILSIGKVGLLAEEAQKEGIEVIGLKKTAKLDDLQNILKTHRVNISCSHFSYFGYPLYYRLGIPNVTFIHNVYAFLCGEVLQRFKDSDRYVDQYIAVSKNAARYALEKLGVGRNKTSIIGNGISVEEHLKKMETLPAVDRESLGLKDEDYVFLNVASYNLHKGHYIMANAMEKLLALREDIKIICIGNVIYPPHVDTFKSYLRRKKIDKHILMPGFFENTTGFYKMADAFIMPSLIEGWSIAMTEAMYYEKPMILTNTGAAAEVIEDNDIGIIVENEYGDIVNLDAQLLDSIAYEKRQFKTAQFIGHAMANFADNRSYWYDAGKKGKEKVLSKHRLDQVVAQYEKIFLEVAQNSKMPISIIELEEDNPVRNCIKDAADLTPVINKTGKVKKAFKSLTGVDVTAALKTKIPVPLKNIIRPFFSTRIYFNFRNRILPAVIYYLANSFFMRLPSYRLRHFYLRKFCKIYIGQESMCLKLLLCLRTSHSHWK